MPHAKSPEWGALWQPGVEDAAARTKPQVRINRKTPSPIGAR